MRDLKSHRENENAFSLEDTLPVREISIQESLQQWLELQIAFEWQLLQTEHLFRQDRLDAMAELQARLQLLNNITHD